MKIDRTHRGPRVVPKREVSQQLSLEMELQQLREDLAVGFLLAFPAWVSTHFSFEEEE